MYKTASPAPFVYSFSGRSPTLLQLQQVKPTMRTATNHIRCNGKENMP